MKKHFPAQRTSSVESEENWDINKNSEPSQPSLSATSAPGVGTPLPSVPPAALSSSKVQTTETHTDQIVLTAGFGSPRSGTLVQGAKPIETGVTDGIGP